jgi:predicted nuclease of predicted toxin-antitoxin system
MTLWLDAHLSPRIARWITEAFTVTASPVPELGLRNSTDAQIFAGTDLTEGNVGNEAGLHKTFASLVSFCF